MAYSSETLATRRPLGGRSPSQLDYAYLAGLFDGEGSIDVVNDAYPRLKITMTDGPTIAWIGDTFGGRVYCEKRSGSAKLVAWRWHMLSRMDVKACIHGMAPFLKLKRSRCEWALVAIDAGERGAVGNARSAILERVRARSHPQRFYPGTGPDSPRPLKQPPDEVSAERQDDAG